MAAMLMALVFVGAAAPSSPTPQPDEVTTSQLDGGHDGAMANAGLTAPLTQAWSVSMPGASYPVIAQGMVFAASQDNNTVTALDQATGATVWSHPVGKPMSLAYDRGTLFMVNRSGLLEAFEAATGVITWTVQLTGRTAFFDPLTVGNGNVYVVGAHEFYENNGGKTLYAVRESDGLILWSNPTIGIYGPPAVTAQGVYVSTSSFDQPTTMWCKETYNLDPETGAQLWHSTDCETGANSPAVAGSGHLLNGDMLYSLSTGAAQGRLTGNPFGWSPFYSALPAIANDVLYAVIPDGNLYALPGTGLGGVKWTFQPAGGGVSASPIVVGGLVFVGSSQGYPPTGNLYALDAATGATTWTTSLAAVPKSLAASNGTLVVYAGNQLLAYRSAGAIVDPPANQSQPSVEGSAELNDTKAADVGVWSGLPSTYTYQWQKCDAGGANCADIQGATGPTYVPGGDAYGKTLRVKVAGINDIGASSPVVSAASPVLGLATAPPVLSTSPALTGTGLAGQQLITTKGTWTNSATTYAYKWQRCGGGAGCVDIAGATTSQYTPGSSDVGYRIRSAVLASNAVGPAAGGYAPSPLLRISRIAKPGPVDQATSYQLDVTHDGAMPTAGLAGPLTQAWSLNLAGSPSNPLIADGMVFVTVGYKTLYALDQATGATIWSHVGGGSLAYDRGRVFTVGGGLLTAYDAATGAMEWTQAPPAPYTNFGLAPVASNGILYTGGSNPGQTIYALRESDGTVLWTQLVTDRDTGGFPAVTPQGVYIQGAYAFDPLLGTPLWHQSLGSGGPIVAGGHLLLGNISVSPANGDVQGSIDAANPIFAPEAPAVANGVSFFVKSQAGSSTWPNTLFAVSDYGMGATNWAFSSDGEVSTSPIVADGRVFFGSGHNKLYALDASTGATSWSADVGYQPTNVAASNGTLVVGSDNRLVAYQPAGAAGNAPANQSPPTVDGGFELNETNAVDVGVWSGLPSSYAYQWELCDPTGGNCADIPGATGLTYAPGAEGFAQTLRVKVVATSGTGSSAPVESAPSEVLGLSMAPPDFSSAPAVHGTPTVGEQLSTTNGAWMNSATSYTYKWQRCDDTGENCSDIPGATAATYVAVADDVGFELRSEVRASNALGPSPSGYQPSAPTNLIAQIGAPTILASPADQVTASQIDPAHDGFMADAGLTAPLTKAWSVQFPTAVSDPLVVNGMVYITTQLTSQVLFQGRYDTAYQNVVYALNQATGATVWTQPLGPPSRQIGASSGLTYDRGQVFVVQPNDISAGTRPQLEAFDAATGALAWTEIPYPDWNAPVSGQPVAVNGIVYSAGGCCGLIAFRESDGHIVWSGLQNPNWGPYNRIGGSDPAVTEQGVYVTNLASQVWDIDPLVGEVLWHRGAGDGSSFPGPPPVVAGGHAYAPGQNLILSASTGALQGTFNALAQNPAYEPPPAIANGVEFTLDGSTLTAVEDNGLGNILWSFTGDGGLDSPPIVVGDVVFIASSSGNLYALDPVTGAITWSTNVGVSTGQYAHPPALAAANGTLVESVARTVVAYRNDVPITAAPVNQSTPSVQGPPDLGGLEAADVGIWSGLPSAYSYQWELCDGAGEHCTDIAGATGASYLPPAADVGIGDTLRVRVGATNGIGSSAGVESTPSVSLPLVVPGQHALRHQGSTTRVTSDAGAPISTTNGIWTDDPGSYEYRWRRCEIDGRHCVTIAGQTDPHYTPLPSDAGYTIFSQVRASNTVGWAVRYAPSATSTLINGGSQPVILQGPVVSGTAAIGRTLSTTDGTWTHSPKGYLYRWQRCDTDGANCAVIKNATTSHYTLVGADAGHKIRSAVDAVNDAGTAVAGYALSAPTDIVLGKQALIAAPTISGEATVGKSLSVTSGTWKFPATFAYQWLRCSAAGGSCKKIAGATGSSYKLTATDVGHKLKATVTATNAIGSAAATSAPSAKVAK